MSDLKKFDSIAPRVTISDDYAVARYLDMVFYYGYEAEVKSPSGHTLWAFTASTVGPDGIEHRRLATYSCLSLGIEQEHMTSVEYGLIKGMTRFFCSYREKMIGHALDIKNRADQAWKEV